MSTPIRRINFFGAPGTGKTVLAHELFVYAKQQGFNCEVINELAREWAYYDRIIQGLDQLLLFANQASREDICLRNYTTDFVITDSPVPMAIFYSLLLDDTLKTSYDGFSKAIDLYYPSVNFFCRHNPKYKYHAAGRHHTKEQSSALEDAMLTFCKSYYGDNLYILPNENRLEAVIAALKNIQLGIIPQLF
jgi:hypothetical protein